MLDQRQAFFLHVEEAQVRDHLETLQRRQKEKDFLNAFGGDGGEDHDGQSVFSRCFLKKQTKATRPENLVLTKNFVKRWEICCRKLRFHWAIDNSRKNPQTSHHNT